LLPYLPSQVSPIHGALGHHPDARLAPHAEALARFSTRKKSELDGTKPASTISSACEAMFGIVRANLIVAPGQKFPLDPVPS